MTDIVERLRLCARQHAAEPAPHPTEKRNMRADESMYWKAADEIERLREALRSVEWCLRSTRTLLKTFDEKFVWYGRESWDREYRAVPMERALMDIDWELSKINEMVPTAETTDAAPAQKSGQ